MCDNLRMMELLSLELDEMLTPEEAVELGGHLASCPDCQAMAADFKRMHSAMTPETYPLPPNFHQNVMDAIQKEQKVIAFPKAKQPWRQFVATAALFALVITGGVLWVNQQNDHQPVTVSAAPRQSPTDGEPATYRSAVPFAMGDSVVALEAMVLELEWTNFTWESDEVIQSEDGAVLTYMGASDGHWGFSLVEGDDESHYQMDMETNALTQNDALDFNQFIK